MCEIVTTAPTDSSAAVLRNFSELVERGGEVTAAGLAGRIKAARALAFLRVAGTLVGVGGVKSPGNAYHRRQFRDSGTELDPGSYPVELGWVFVDQAYRGRRFSSRLVEALLAHATWPAMFATTRSDNEAMLRTLRRHGFVETGTAYASGNGDYSLRLLVRVP